mmetsp:Transcript_31645/g.51076  ORF Transcript_31645/g.51076 Transcript_31645/m.51076 type:complete len:370 (-) Transcript_31645:126-1235(-)|eukprot:CAMPEP_0184645358 /NCGR_PEP_ID=MMETSP0308-20130426/1832_1 /TAXON_ID=38269 /ORGANISM="Gloeochaete witrockiana, Strain SAG 46.84" /LENGTH=369 /DNA_ID=CAMNT_0027074283 /DNA_START=76 /DNA_END=1185 /DNA_ORIENTATION=-
MNAALQGSPDRRAYVSSSKRENGNNNEFSSFRRGKPAVPNDSRTTVDIEDEHKVRTRGPASGFSLSAIYRDRDSQKLFIVILLNTACAITGLFWGLSQGQESLVSDTLYMLFDSCAYSAALAAILVSRSPASPSFSYGFERIEVIAAFCNAALLLFYGATASIHTVQKALMREWDAHHHTENVGFFAVALFMLAVNAWGMQAFRAHAMRPMELRRGRDENLHVVYLHLLFNLLDAAGFLLVAMTSQILFLHRILKPTVSILSAVLIIRHGWPPFSRTALILLQTTPEPLKGTLDLCMRETSSLEGVSDIDMPHFWWQSPGTLVGSLSLRTHPDADEGILMSRVQKIFGPIVRDLTVQVTKDSPDQTQAR